MIEPFGESVLVIGASSSDIKGRASSKLQHGTSNAGLVRRSLGGVARNIAENLARLDLNVTLLTAVGDDHAGPQGLQEFILAHHPVPLLHEIQEQVEHARLQRNLPPLKAQCTAVSVEFESREAMDACCH